MRCNSPLVISLALHKLGEFKTTTDENLCISTMHRHPNNLHSYGDGTAVWYSPQVPCGLYIFLFLNLLFHEGYINRIWKINKGRIKVMDLKERVKMFMYDTGAKLSVFSKKVQISDTYYYAWMHDKIEPSDEMCERIQAYLDEVYKK